MRTGREYDLLRLSGRDETVVKYLHHRIEAHCRAHRHVERAAHDAASAEDMTLAALLARVAVERCETGQLRCARIAYPAQLGHERQHDGAGDRANALDCIEATRLFLEVTLEVRVDIALDAGNLFVQ